MLYIDPVQLMIALMTIAALFAILTSSLVFFVTRAIRNFIRRFPHLIKD